jgi:hypothetical protein
VLSLPRKAALAALTLPLLVTLPQAAQAQAHIPEACPPQCFTFPPSSSPPPPAPAGPGQYVVEGTSSEQPEGPEQLFRSTARCGAGDEFVAGGHTSENVTLIDEAPIQDVGEDDVKTFGWTVTGVQTSGDGFRYSLTAYVVCSGDNQPAS